MRAFWPIYKRELFAFFVTPLAWVLITVFLLVQGMHFFLLVDHFARSAEVVGRPDAAPGLLRRTRSSSTSSSSSSSPR